MAEKRIVKASLKYRLSNMGPFSVSYERCSAGRVK